MASVIGRRFGNWTAIAPCRARRITCRCDCGTEADVLAANLYGGKSFGCLTCGRLKRTTHGLSNTREYRRWISMIQRCHNPRHPAYADYGARGIYVCERWRESFESYYADMGPRPAGYSLDRVDNDGPYAPENCRWATPKQQRRNTRSNRMLSLNGRTMTESAWAEELGISRQALDQRLDAGWSLERALTSPRTEPERRNAKPAPKGRPARMTCSSCGELGHNRRSCSKTEAA